MSTRLGSSFVPAATPSQTDRGVSIPADLFDTPSLQHLNGPEPVAGIAVIPVMKVSGKSQTGAIVEEVLVYAPAALNENQLAGIDTGTLHTIRTAQSLADDLNRMSHELALRADADHWVAQETKLATAHTSFTFGTPANHSVPSR